MRLWILTPLLGLGLLAGCGKMMMTELGALDGVKFAGVPGKCGQEDRAVLLSTFDINLFCWQIGSGSLAWNARRKAIDGGADSSIDWTNQGNMIESLKKIARTYDSDIYRVEFNDKDDFSVSLFGIWGNLLYWCFPGHEVSVSAILKKRKPTR